VVVEASHLTKAFGDRLLLDDLSFTLPRNGIVGVIGPNGVGKTTLFKMIVAAATNEDADKDVLPTSGDIEVGETVVLSYVDQSPARAWTLPRTSGRSSRMAWTGSRSAMSRCPSRAYVSGLRVQGPGPAESRHRRSPAASATG
jgi:ATPase subunit of ABC transporter with duplicated ATPase domains